MFHVKHSLDDTIAAIATPLGTGGVGVVRVSGGRARAILNTIFYKNNKKKLISHQLTHGWIKETGSQQKIDEVMACYMKGPGTFTGEDVVEIYCHGGQAIVRKIVEAAIKKGARPAERGEFTKRAFLNGKMDLAQAEAVLDLIKATTGEGAGYALRQLEGQLSKEIAGIRDRLVKVMAEVELQIDFGEEMPPISYPQVLKKIVSEMSRIEALLKSESTGRVYRQGVSVAITGKPNVGKSSLLNAILEEERAIVAESPGTTRDTIEEVIEIKGLPIKLIDTAGIRKTKDKEKVEGLGIAKAKKAVAEAEYIILMIDGSKKTDQEDEAVVAGARGKKGVFVVNKIDLGIQARASETMRGRIKMPLIKASALLGEGIKKILGKLYEIIIKNEGLEGGGNFAINERHKGCLVRARESLRQASKAIGQKEPVEIVAVEIKEAISALGEITGEEVSAEVIKTIFEQFCVGK